MARLDILGNNNGGYIGSNRAGYIEKQQGQTHREITRLDQERLRVQKKSTSSQSEGFRSESETSLTK